MVWVFWANQKVKVHKARARCYIEPHLYVWEDELRARKATCGVVLEQFFVIVGNVIIGDSNGFDLWRDLFERSEITSPGIAVAELIVQNSSWGVDMGFPAPPFRSSIDHRPPLHLRGCCLMYRAQAKAATQVDRFQFTTRILGEKPQGQQFIAAKGMRVVLRRRRREKGEGAGGGTSPAAFRGGGVQVRLEVV
jgi:hypothetical protein